MKKQQTRRLPEKILSQICVASAKQELLSSLLGKANWAKQLSSEVSRAKRASHSSMSMLLLSSALTRKFVYLTLGEDH